MGGPSLAAGAAEALQQQQQPMKEPFMKESPSPFDLARVEVDCISERLRHSVVSDIPDLATAANYYFKVAAGKSPPPMFLALFISSFRARLFGGRDI